MKALIVWSFNLIAFPLFPCAMKFYRSMAHLFVKLHFQNTAIASFLVPGTEPASACSVASLNSEDPIFGDCDAELVMKELGLWSSEGGDCGFMKGARILLEEKEASMDELEAAFAVFDEGGDGFISAEELQRVMQRLGLEEGMRLEDCNRMITAFDVDGDGMIELNEFKNLMELVK